MLLANYQDPTLLMNAVTFELGRRIGLAYTNHSIPIDVMLNGAYIGNYLLTEQVQTGAGRVDIDEDNGWFVQIDEYYDEDPKFLSTNYQLYVMVKTPEIDSNDINDPIFTTVKSDINALDTAIYSPSFPESDYRSLIEWLSLRLDYLNTEINRY